MVMISEKDKARVLESMKAGCIDAACGSEAGLVDEIIRVMHNKGLTEGLCGSFEDHRERKAIPFALVLLLAIAAKMKVNTSLTDIPFGIKDTQTLEELGFCLWDSERDLRKGLADEGSIRAIVGKHRDEEWFEGYNHFVQGAAFAVLEAQPSLHILDCTKIEVNLKNHHYEGAGYMRDEEGGHRGYKLSTLRGITGDQGIIEEVRFGSIETHDLALSREMLFETPVLREGDKLLEDRGFLSRPVMNRLKMERKVDTFVPLRKDMEAYEMAVSLAKEAGKWSAHPNPKRKTQVFAQVDSLGAYWISDNPEEDVELTGCVVWDKKKDAYYVFVTTDMEMDARLLLKTYELRPEIEEDYRQIKDYWKIEHFLSRKKNVIAFHIVMTLLGYLFFQIYMQTEEGAAYAGQSLPVALKKYRPKKPLNVIVAAGQYFASFPLLEMMQLYASLAADVRQRLDVVLALA